MTPDTVLMFAYHFPPENAIGGLRPFRFYKYLSRNGLKCHVITAAAGAADIVPDAESIPDLFLTESRGGLGWQFERAVRKLVLPAVTGTRWAFAASRAGQMFLRANPSARVVILSTYPPLGPHLAAWRLAHLTKLPWVTDFRDPMGDNPANILMPRRSRLIERFLERRTMRDARAVVANTDGAAERLRKIYPQWRDKIHLIWNGFDPEARVHPAPLSMSSRKVMSHVGSLYGSRDAKPLLESIARLVDCGRLRPEAILLRLVGVAKPDSVPGPELLQKAARQGWLELITEQVPQSQAQGITASSGATLLIQPRSTLQVPGKLFEYLQIGRPILAYLPPDSPSERILQHSGIPYRCVYAGKEPAVMDQQIAEFFEMPWADAVPSPWFEEHFNAERQTAALQRLLESVATG
ncbi:MAG: glycosyltransferase [Acidobacteriia bacterium]|nr:glycosyltransferase [Terriglobia bacterium]